MNREQAKQENEILSEQQAKKLRIGIVMAKFNADITEKLLLSAGTTLLRAGVLEKNIDITEVPGGFEIPLGCQRMLESKKKYDALIAIGCVIRGDTDHYVYIAGEATRGTMEVMLASGIPIANCILTVNTLKQAQDRCGRTGNKGSESALSALEMAVD